MTRRPFQRKLRPMRWWVNAGLVLFVCLLVGGALAGWAGGYYAVAVAEVAILSLWVAWVVLKRPQPG